jgi:hypothetical protein
MPSLIMRTLILLLVVCLYASNSAAASVMFDESHAQQFLVGGERELDLSRLAKSYRDMGYEVASNTERLTTELLSSVDVLVISGAFKPVDHDEQKAILDFINAGGALAVTLHIAPPLASLLHRLDVDFTNGTLRETTGVIDGNPLNFKVSHFSDHPVTNGLTGFSIYGSWALRATAPHVRIIAETSQSGWVDLDRNNQLSRNDAVQRFGVMAAGELGRGRYVVLGDDAVFQNRFFDEDNRELSLRIVDWLSFR